MRRPFPYPTKRDLTTTAVSGAVGIAAGVALAKTVSKHETRTRDVLPDDPAWHAAVASKHPPRGF